jgi:hypothetical protein
MLEQNPGAVRDRDRRRDVLAGAAAGVVAVLCAVAVVCILRRLTEIVESRPIAPIAAISQAPAPAAAAAPGVALDAGEPAPPAWREPYQPVSSRLSPPAWPALGCVVVDVAGEDPAAAGERARARLLSFLASHAPAPARRVR